MNENLTRLAKLAGIQEGWWDFFGKWRVVPDETKRAFLAAMGIAAGDEEACAASLLAFEEESWRRRLPPATIAVEDGAKPNFAISLPADLDEADFQWTLAYEDGRADSGPFKPKDLVCEAERRIDGKLYRRRRFGFLHMPALGYHKFVLKGAGKNAEMDLIVAPARGHEPEAVLLGGKLWGISCQIYGLRGAADWGIGDYRTLGDFCARAGELGAGAVGINPVHALFPESPERFSPYSPSSRQFVATTYLSIEAIPDLAECPEARALIAAPDFQAKLAEARGKELVDYPAVAALHAPVLALLWKSFRLRHLENGKEKISSRRGRAFRRFQKEGGPALERFALFEALRAHFLAEGADGYWRRWPEAYRDPDSKAVRAFAAKNQDAMEFAQYRQWLADEQLAAAAAECRARSMGIGLYRDLGVGIADDGADSWAGQEFLCAGVSTGAPPDPLNLKGQDWGLAPFDPHELRRRSYRPFIAALRANMRHAGALRLDHAMLLTRLYWVPSGVAADQGAYVEYPFDDLLSLVALESRRNKCLVIGEDLGTVPDGFREKMKARGIYAYRLMIFERDKSGAFKAPGVYEEQALVSSGTHDMPPLMGFWQGTDLDERERLALYPDADFGPREREARKADRVRLVAALRTLGLLPAGFPDAGALTRERAEALILAAYRFLVRAPSRLLMVQIEDLTLQDRQMNLPGTVDQHPNWRRRYRDEAPELGRADLLPKLLEMLNGERPSVGLGEED